MVYPLRYRSFKSQINLDEGNSITVNAVEHLDISTILFRTLTNCSTSARSVEKYCEN